MLRITSINFKNYKSFDDFSVSLTEFNILVGPNNAGKSTVIGSLKILAEGIRKANYRNPVLITDPKGVETLGYQIDLDEVPVATENVFHNYLDGTPAVIRFRLSNGSFLQIFFPEQGICYMNCESPVTVVRTTKEFKEQFPIEIGYVPILGPVEHREPLYQKEAARLALLTHYASRNFRNIWFHYYEDFTEFKELVKSTWPGMDIDPPEIDRSGKKPLLFMFCPEQRIPREIFWAGFGFQVWCQMLTYIIKNKKVSLFIIDEPDIYLHSDLQRQLLIILKNLGPDILIATHSTEIISEADLNDILIINKSAKSAKRIKDPSELQKIFNILGSNLNPILTQIAKSKRILFVEGKDFSFFSKMAQKKGLAKVGNRSDFAVVPVEGFNPIKLKDIKLGIEKTIGSKVLSAVIFDKDYRSDDEVKSELAELRKGNYFAHIHSCKELENFLIIENPIEAAIKIRIKEHNIRTGKSIAFSEDIKDLFNRISNTFKFKVQAQLQSHQLKFAKQNNPELDNTTITEKILSMFDVSWNDLELRLKLIPGKDFLSALNQYLQDKYAITISYTNIINCIGNSDFPLEIYELLKKVDEFRRASIP